VPNQVPTDDKPENIVADEPNSADAPASATVGRPAAASGAKRGVLPIVLAALCVAAAVVVGLLGWQAISASHAQSDSDAALDAARTRSVFVLSYAPATVDADIQKARAQLSGTFAAQFDQLVNSVVLPATKQQGLASKVDVTHSAVIESHPDRADVLLLMHQVVSSTNQPPQEGTIQVKVTVTKTPDGQWLISSLQPI
jgi:Mce-associated membrane protein